MYENVHFKYVQHIVCQLYLNKAVGREERKEQRRKGGEMKGAWKWGGEDEDMRERKSE